MLLTMIDEATGSKLKAAPLTNNTINTLFVKKYRGAATVVLCRWIKPLTPTRMVYR